MNSVASTCKVLPVRQGTGKEDYVRNDFKNRKCFVLSCLDIHLK